MSNSTALRIPYGTKDILPGDARLKRELEDRVAGNFLSWGYDEAITPTFEYADTFALSGAGISDESMRFMDRNNRTVMLRSEMTTPLARMVATRLKNDKGVKRLFYIANVFRHEQTQAGRQCEFSQRLPGRAYGRSPADGKTGGLRKDHDPHPQRGGAGRSC